MKYLLILPMLAALSLSSCKNAEEKNSEPVAKDFAYNSYGEEISAESCLSAVEMEERFKNLKPGDTIEISFKTKVNSVCKNKGCWMNLKLGDSQEVAVKFRDYAFFVPKDIEEKDVVVKGKAYVSVVSVEDQRHYAEDAGKTPEEIQAITEPKTTLSFLADGVLIEQ